MNRQKRLITISLILGGLLMLIKFSAFLITGSNAILTDAMESIVNVVASGFAFYSIHLAAKPKDENHPYGHGKVEFFSVFLEGGLIFIAGILILGKAVYNLFFPEEIENLLEGIGLIGLTGLVNWAYGTHLVIQSKKLKSLTIEADGKHLQTDAYSTLGLLVGLGLIYLTGWTWLDIVISLGLGLFILINGYYLLRKSIGGLMDESDVELVKDIIEVLEKNRKDAWIDVHNLRVQRYGQELHLDCHVTMPSYYELQLVHEEMSAIDNALNSAHLAKTELFIHVDPCVPECCSYCQVSNCPIRTEPFKKMIPWDVDIVSKNQKHFK
jgi:cation diffusion facilitator family transporter